jgi:RimJ/RimL family protein N-acetyltransferase
MGGPCRVGVDHRGPGTTEVIVEGNHEHGHILAKDAGVYFNPVCDKVIASTNGEKLLGGVIYQGFTQASIGIHCASYSPYWFNRDMFWIVFNYPFEQLNVAKLIGQVPSRNLKSLEFCLKLGFKEETRVADVFPDGEDLLVLSMRREDCRWLKLKPRGAHSG